MARTGYSDLVAYIQTLFLGALIIQNALNISGSLFSVIHTSDDCSHIARMWLIVNSSVVLFSLCVFLCYKAIGF